ncbi:unnamed protein product [Effrenium voratum]|uniref:Aspartyl/asparaginy/proline hydroxylase domain-containing protein n=1 Tax=Effrenium voratum TaxID=2562239 RepID=A0AA36I8X0_9DINO|nr:unnamed protein product [Effrenium voratum]CAJ1419558.1 unnamed protein product [Effrenium voratum]
MDDGHWADGVRAFFQGDTDLALRQFHLGLEKEEVSTKILARRLYFVAELEKGLGDAIRCLRRAAQLDPELKQAHVALCLALEEAGEEEALRSAACRAVVEGGLWSHWRQRPAAFLPGLAASPWWPAELFPWVKALEARAKNLRRRLDLRTIFDAAPWAPVGGQHRASGSHDGHALRRGAWHEIVLFGLGNEAEEGRSRFLALAEAVQSAVPEAVTMAQEGAGEVILSALGPGSHVARHCGRANHRLTAHLGLCIPQGCGIQVGGEWRCGRLSWQEDKILIFDDSFEHEVQNNSNSTRVVLLIRFWHPALNPPERRKAALEHIQAELAYTQRLQTLPPLAPDYAEPTRALEEHLLGSGACPNCRSLRGGDLTLDEQKGRARLVLSCCGHALE